MTKYLPLLLYFVQIFIEINVGNIYNIYIKRVIWKSNKFKAVYTDHFPLEIILSGLPRRNQKALKGTMWNLGKPGGWDNYKQLTDERPGKLIMLLKMRMLQLQR